MPSLVSEFIINPVLRQARRFSSGFATEEPPAVRHNRPRSAGENDVVGTAILEGDTDGNETSTNHTGPLPGTRAGAGAEPRLAVGLGDNARNSLGRNTLVERQPLATLDPNQVPSNQRPPAQPSSPDDGAARLEWADEGSKNGPLPEDDGNGELRKKIQAIQGMEAPQNLKAQLVHQLLMEGYMKSRQAPPTSPTLHPESPVSRSAPDRPGSNGPLQALKFWNPLSDGPDLPLDLPLSEADLRPTYVPAVPPGDDIAEPLGRLEIEDHGQPFLGCEHYRRNVKMQCATCEKWYTCRFCHDAVEDHALPRKDTKHMLCMLCGCAQKASAACTRCGESAASYFCGVCKLWSSDPNKPIYHCNDCGLCRVGQGLGKDFFHCKKCMACIAMTAGHKCIERSTDCDCPICGDYMFNSPKPVVFMQCGHSIHRRCLDEHKRTSYKCPLCAKSCDNMDAQFRNYDLQILHQPMPAEYRDARAVISCNDCSAKSQTAYHWLGLKCSLCSSYNTVQLQLLNMPGQERSSRDVGTVSGASSANWVPRAVRRLSDLGARGTSADMSTLTRDLRRRARARERVEASPSVLSRLFAPRSVPNPSPASTSIAALGSNATAHDSDSEEEINHETLPIQARGLAATGVDDSELELEDEEDILDFWGRSGDDTRGITSDGGVDDGEEEEEEESESSSDEDDGCEEDDDDDEEEIVLLGHR
ncbi:hypothetical protein OQA88_12145 [Cercophora sp. LCS_1]